MISKDEWKSFSEAGKIKSKIESHITEALREIFIIYGGKLTTWYYPGAQEGCIGEMRIYSDSINIETESKVNIKSEAEYEDSEYSGYLTCDFPIHFLFLSISDIVSKVKKFKANADKQEKAERQKKEKVAKIRQVEKNKLVQSASSKLTTEEKKALGIK